MYKKIVFFILLISALALSACSTTTTNTQPIINGSGKVTTETRSVSGFTQVALNGVGNVNVILGDHDSVAIGAEDNLMKYITTTLEGSRLVISISNGVQINPTRPVNYTVTLKSLDGLSVGGSGNMTVDTPRSEQITLEITGSGDINVTHLDTSMLAATISGSGSINLIGRATNQTVNITGSGNFNAGDLNSGAAEVTISGSGNATVWSTGALKATLLGSGNVRYFEGSTLNPSILGNGKIINMGAHS
jgi:hypothetical protein